MASQKLKTSFFVLASCRSCVLPSVLVARRREQLLAVRTLHQFSGIIFRDGVYWRMTLVGQSSAKLETKNTSIFILAGRAC